MSKKGKDNLPFFAFSTGSTNPIKIRENWALVIGTRYTLRIKGTKKNSLCTTSTKLVAHSGITKKIKTVNGVKYF